MDSGGSVAQPVPVQPVVPPSASSSNITDLVQQPGELVALRGQWSTAWRCTVPDLGHPQQFDVYRPIVRNSRYKAVVQQGGDMAVERSA